jgi:flagellar motor protein MotB
MVPAAKNMVDRWKVQPDDEDARIERIVRKATEEIEMSPERYRSLLSAIKPVDIFIPLPLATTEGGALQPQKNREALDMIVELLKRFDKTKVTIEGYTDIDFKEASIEQNLALAERRAKEVSEYLMSKGIQRSRITLVSYGKDRPLVRGRATDAHKLNNRIRLIFT